VTRARAWLLLAAIVLVALNLRAGIVSVSPLLDVIRDQTGMSGTAAGLLTTLPVLCFGALAPLAPRLARRFGASAVVGGAMAVLAAGLLVRIVPSIPVLFAGTVLVGGAIAVSNVLLPSIIKRDFAARSGPVLGVYAMALNGSAALAAGATLPLRDATGLGWRATLALWAVLALAAWLVWSVATRGTPSPRQIPGAHVPVRLWRDRVAWSVSLYMGVGSVQFYAAFAWFPTILIDHGVASDTAGWLLAVMGIAGTASSLVIPALASRARYQGGYVALIVAVYVVGWVGMLAAPVGGAVVWACLLGASQGAGISLALTLMVLRSPDARHAAELSGMAQTVGYLMAALGPLGVGALHDVTGGWTAPMALMLALLVPLLIVGVLAGRPRLVAVGPDEPAGPGGAVAPTA
jgi:CP family cyanate transporter-like MFS transporter